MIWLFSERMVRMAIQLVVGIWLQNYLGEAQVGILGYVIAFVSLFQILPAFGSKGILIHEFVEKGGEKTYFGLAVSMHMMASFIAIALCIITHRVFVGNTDAYLFIVIFSVSLAFYPLHVAEYYFQAQLKTHYVAIAYFFTYLISAVLKVIGIVKGQPLVYFVYVATVENTLLCLAFLLAYFHCKKKIAFPIFFEKKRAWQLLKRALPLLTASGFVILFMRTDQIIIKYLLGNIALGNYVVALKLSEMFYFLPPILANLASSGIVKAHQKSQSEFRKLLQKYYNATTWLGVVVSLITYLAAEELILLFYKGNFLEAIPVLKIYVWSIVFVFMGMISDRWILQEKVYHISLFRNMIGFVLNVILNILWLPIVGIVGGAWATLVSYSVAYCFSHLLFKKSHIVFRMQWRSIAFPIVYLWNWISNFRF